MKGRKVEIMRTLKRRYHRLQLCLSIVSLVFYAIQTTNCCHGWSTTKTPLISKHFHNPLSVIQDGPKVKSYTLKASSISISIPESDVPSAYSSPLLNSATFSSESLMGPIVNHPSIQLLELEKRPRKKLKPRHKSYFLQSSTNNASLDDPEHSDCPTLFQKLAIACCDSGVVPRKEFFETYAAARFIHDSFPSSVFRIADLAAGHGLLSWMLLAMDEYCEDGRQHDDDTRDRVQRRTAICIDRRMPPSAIAIAKSMRTHLFPVDDNGQDDVDGDDDRALYDSRWTFVETDLGNVVVDDASTLLVSVHACGTLSDFLIEMAVSGKAPLSLVPCCHTYSVRKGYTPHPLFSETTAEEVQSKIERLQQQNGSIPPKKTKQASKTHQKFQIVENVIDEVRWKTLRNAGYGNVRIASLPQEFTERNRLFLAHKQNLAIDDENDVDIIGETPIVETQQISETNSRKSIRKGSMPPAKKTDKTQSANQPIFTVHVRDDPKSIEECLSISGKAKAIERLRALLPNHFAPKLDVSMWLSPPLEDGVTVEENASPTNVTIEALQMVLDDVVVKYRKTNKSFDDDDKKYRCTISAINEVFVHPTTQRSACTYQIEYSYESSTIEENGAPFPKKIAKELHKSFCNNVVHSIDGTEIR